MKKITGLLINFTPVIYAGVLKDGNLIIGKGRYPIVIDSGFNGDISAPSEILDQLDLEYSGAMPFQLADGRIVMKNLWAGKVILGSYEYEALFIEGDFLLGMELASDLFSYFLIDFKKKKIELGI